MCNFGKLPLKFGFIVLQIILSSKGISNEIDFNVVFCSIAGNGVNAIIYIYIF